MGARAQALHTTGARNCCCCCCARPLLLRTAAAAAQCRCRWARLPQQLRQHTVHNGRTLHAQQASHAARQAAGAKYLGGNPPVHQQAVLSDRLGPKHVGHAQRAVGAQEHGGGVVAGHHQAHRVLQRVCVGCVCVCVGGGGGGTDGRQVWRPRPKIAVHCQRTHARTRQGPPAASAAPSRLGT